jgi:hypothetical protein
VLIKWVWRDEMTEEIGAMERVDGYEVELRSDVERGGGGVGEEGALLGWQSCPQKGILSRLFSKKNVRKEKIGSFMLQGIVHVTFCSVKGKLVSS